MPNALRTFLHDLIDATAGTGHADRLHAALDAIGGASDAAPAEAAAEPAAEEAPAADVTVPADELASFRAWQASQAAPVAEEVTGG